MSANVTPVTSTQNELSKPTYNPSAHSFSGWLGGKSQLARTIVDMMPAHKHYCEVFGGAGWVLFKKRLQPRNALMILMVT